MYKIAILASGNGSNAENITRLFHEGNKIRVAIVISNREKAKVHERMRPLGVPTATFTNDVWDNDPKQIVDMLKSYEIDLVVLAGFMHKIEPEIINAYKDRIINIHPSLLPAYGGKGMWGHHVHHAVIANGEKKSGVTVHYVSEEIDGGEILMQESIDLVEGETPKSLEEKIHKIEYSLYPRAIVAAVNRLSPNPKDTSATPTPVKIEQPAEMSAEQKRQTADEAWAKELGLKYDRETAAKSENPEIPTTAGQSNQITPTPPPTQNHFSPTSPNNPSKQEPMPPTYLVWAVVMTILCCTIPGIVAIIFSTQVSSKYYSGDIEGAKRASKRTETWIIVSFVLGILSATVIGPLMMIKDLF